MKFTVNAKSMLTMLSQIIRIIPEKTSIPVVQDFLFNANAKDNVLYVTASDGTTFITAPVPSAVIPKNDKSPSSALIPAFLLVELLKTMDGDADVRFETDNMKAVVSWDNGRANIPVFDAEDGSYPSEKPIDRKNADFIEFKIDAALAATAIERTLSSVETGPTLHQTLTCLLLDLKKGGGTSVVASDMKVLTCARLETEVDQDYDLLLPGRDTKVFSSLLATALAEDGDGDGKKKENNMFIRTDGIRIQLLAGVFDMRCSAVKGNFPDYKKIIPESASSTLTVNPTELLATIKRVSSAIGKTNSRLVFELSGNMMKTVVSDDTLHANVQESLDFCEYAGEDLRIGFNTGDMMRVLKQFDKNENVVFKFNGAKKGVLIVPEKNEDEMKALIMPFKMA